MRYQVVEDHREDYPVSVLCGTLGVSLSGYYAWKKRPMSKHQQEDSQLTEHIQEAYQSCRQVYGSPHIHAELRAGGITSSRKRVARLMRERGLTMAHLCGGSRLERESSTKENECHAKRAKNVHERV